jgi:hypothetical protein
LSTNSLPIFAQPSDKISPLNETAAAAVVKIHIFREIAEQWFNLKPIVWQAHFLVSVQPYFKQMKA